ncbi:hypothetical protein EW145_g1370 [Phellinidium pouzarii]|uniref:Uncharacterized protein n=1 Tax=Phellinidium pouzarii TaxID=167371 RepID=A0A4S4LER8_9AGAM|nr:hypothetical protein EW145_g1370 [Phellinidium pouzarii]
MIPTAILAVFSRAADVDQTHLRVDTSGATNAPDAVLSQQATAAEPTPTTPAPESDPISPPPLTDSPVLDAKDVFKETRAFEVSRQRAKHPFDRRKARDQKAKRGTDGPASKGLRVGDVDVNFTATEVAEAAAVKAVTPRVRMEKPPKGLNGSRKVTVHLEELIRFAKVRKEKGVCQQCLGRDFLVGFADTVLPIAGDFELIPQVRAVVALDDFESEGEITIPAFDDWEHVESCTSSGSSDEDEAAAVAPKAPSYAQIVLSSKH